MDKAGRIRNIFAVSIFVKDFIQPLQKFKV